MAPEPSSPPVARIWRGAVRAADRQEYLRYLEDTGIAEYRDTPGNRSVQVLLRDVGDRTEFMIVTLWDSRDDIVAFAGDDIERAVFYPEDDRFLVERGETVTHHDVVTYGG
jgi:heme-degrading monooxygenase HmoA